MPAPRAFDASPYLHTYRGWASEGEEVSLAGSKPRMMTFREFVTLVEGLLKPDRLADGPRRVNLLPRIRTRRRQRLTPPRLRPLFPYPTPTPLSLRMANPPKLAPPSGPPGPPV